MNLDTIFLAINWSSVGLKVAQLLLSLSILVILHEFGHYITAKWFKCRVEKFYLFFDPWFSLFKKKIGETVYGIGWLPLGGYVKIAGMVDESMDKEQEKRKKSDGPLISPRVPSLVTEVNDTSMVYKAGLRKGDYITAIDSIPAQYMDELRNIAATHKSTQVVLQVNRAGSNVSIPAKISNEGKIGFAGIAFVEQMDSLGILKYSVRKYGFFESLPAGVRRAGEELVFYIDQFKKILSPSTGAYKGVGGFKAMGSVFSGDTWDWEHFWTITAFFSIVLAFMNLLPIPALDGGHVLFTLIEMVTGRKPSDKFLEYAQIGGMIILLLLMLYANGNDWFGWGKGR
ncbi:MAG: site-2 protease family protein [Chitinophagaceae bacterium]|nr:site-2 protease family protein [Chitinophagaceae bacterium]